MELKKLSLDVIKDLNVEELAITIEGVNKKIEFSKIGNSVIIVFKERLKISKGQKLNIVLK